MCSNNSYNISGNLIHFNLINSRTELDTHDNTCTVDQNTLVIRVHEKYGIPKRVNVHDYDPALWSVNDLHFLNAAVAYDPPHTGEVLILNAN